MRQKQFPEVYTTWPTMKDVKASDAEYITAYQNYIADEDLISAAGALDNLKNKIMYTSDWQERYDVCDEMLDYVTNQSITKYMVKDSAPSSDYSIWIDTSNTGVALQDITITETEFTYQYNSSQATTAYVGINRVPPNAVAPYKVVVTENGTSYPSGGISNKSTSGFQINFTKYPEPSARVLTTTYTYTVQAYKSATETIGSAYTIKINIKRRETIECQCAYTNTASDPAAALKYFELSIEQYSDKTWSEVYNLIYDHDNSTFHIDKPADGKYTKLRLCFKFNSTETSVAYNSYRTYCYFNIIGNQNSGEITWLRVPTQEPIEDYSIYQYDRMTDESTKTTSSVFQVNKAIKINTEISNPSYTGVPYYCSPVITYVNT